MTNVLFLDIDGVLLPFGSYNWDLHKVFSKPYNYLDRMVKRTVGVEEIKRFCEEKDCKIVLISTWRYLFEERFLFEYIRSLGLAEYLYQTHWIAKDDTTSYRPKNYDINRWLTWQGPAAGNWWIIDDEDHGVPEGHWIKTDPYKGYVDVQS